MSERMVKMGHDVTIATTKLPERKQKVINGVKIFEFDIKGNSIVGISGEIKKYQDFLIDSNFDVIMNYAAQQWATDLTFPILDKIKAKKILVPCGYSALDNPDFTNYFKKIPVFLKKYNASIYLSDNYRDINFARKHKINNLYVIPNGADEHEFKKLAVDKSFRKKHGIKHFFILTVGHHTGAKGHFEMLKTFQYFPFPSTFVLIGDNPEDGCYVACLKTAKEINRTQRRFGKKVLVVNLSRQETVEALKSADLLLFLSNVEASPLVLFEAAAAGVPFLASDAGNSEEIAEWTGAGVIAASYPDDEHQGNVRVSEKDALKKLVKLYLSPRLRRSLGKNGRKNWETKFTWQKITDQYLKVYEAVRK